MKFPFFWSSLYVLLFKRSHVSCHFSTSTIWLSNSHAVWIQLYNFWIIQSSADFADLHGLTKHLCTHLQILCLKSERWKNLEPNTYWSGSSPWSDKFCKHLQIKLTFLEYRSPGEQATRTVDTKVCTLSKHVVSKYVNHFDC